MTGMEPAYSAWEFLPFLGGRRPCIGEHFVRLETTLAQGNIVRAVEIDSVHDDFECEVPFTTVAKGTNPGPRLAASRKGADAELGSPITPVACRAAI